MKAFLDKRGKGRVKPRPLFDIIVHRKFLDGLKGSVASDTLNLVRGNLDLFTAKQQKQLTSNNYELYRKYSPINVLDSDEDHFNWRNLMKLTRLISLHHLKW